MFKLNADVHVHNTRHKTDLHSDIRTLSVRACTVRFAGVKLWNSLTKSVDLECITNVRQFKRHYKYWLLKYNINL